jgi:elongation factor P
MVIASDLREGSVIRVEGNVYRVLEVESKAGAAKMGGVVKVKLINVHSGRFWEPHFRPQEKLEDLELECHMMEFLYSASGACTFMRPDTYEQIEIPTAIVGPGEKFLQPGMELPVEFFDGEPISVVFPDVVEARVATTAPPSHSHQDSAWKQATLENGFDILVPLFLAPGETVRVEVKTGRYVERARIERKRSA